MKAKERIPSTVKMTTPSMENPKEVEKDRTPTLNVIQAALRLRTGFIEVFCDNFLKRHRSGSPSKEQIVKDLYMMEIRIALRGIKTEDISEAIIKNFEDVFVHSWKYKQILSSSLGDKQE